MFDWSAEFPLVLEEGAPAETRGFDAVIGNPPYIFTRELLSSHERRYYGSTFELSRDKHNTFMLFMELSLRVISPSGLIGLIVPNSWLTIESARLLRGCYADRLLRLADLNYQVFRGVAMEPCVFIASGLEQTTPVEVCRADSEIALQTQECTLADRKRWLTMGGRIVFSNHGDYDRVADRILEHSRPIGEVFDVRSGLQAYERGKGTRRRRQRMWPTTSSTGLLGRMKTATATCRGRTWDATSFGGPACGCSMVHGSRSLANSQSSLGHESCFERSRPTSHTAFSPHWSGRRTSTTRAS